MDVTESHHILLIKFSHLNRTTLTFVLKFSPLQVAKFNISTISPWTPHQGSALDLLGALCGPLIPRPKLCLHFILYLATPLVWSCSTLFIMINSYKNSASQSIESIAKIIINAICMKETFRKHSKNKISEFMLAHGAIMSSNTDW
jgi:hypothetical protein